MTKLVRSMLGAKLHDDLLKARRKYCEGLGIYKYSRVGYWKEIFKYISEDNVGTFIEAGAHDGWSGSNTYTLEKVLKWKGILVEPIPDLFRECKVNRPGSLVFNAALVSDDFVDSEVEISVAGLVSTVTGSALEAQSRSTAIYHFKYEDKKIKVPARTLNSIISESGFGEIDLLSLDVEGFEAQALCGLDLRQYAPRLILVEANFPKQIIDILERYYNILDNFGNNDILFKIK